MLYRCEIIYKMTDPINTLTPRRKHLHSVVEYSVLTFLELGEILDILAACICDCDEGYSPAQGQWV